MRQKAMSPQALADWFENSSPEDYDEVIAGEALSSLPKPVAVHVVDNPSVPENLQLPQRSQHCLSTTSRRTQHGSALTAQCG